MNVSHNIASLNIYNSYKAALASQSKSMNRISSGIRVNEASDDPYAQAQDTAFNMQLKGLQMANQNAQDGVSLLQTAEGGLNGINTMLERIQTLATEAANGTETAGDNSNIQLEISNLVSGISNLAGGTNINGVRLLNAPTNSATPTTNGATSLIATIGANVGQNVDIPTYNFNASNITYTDNSGKTTALSDIDVTKDPATALNVVEAAMTQVNSALSKYGALENRFSSAVMNIGSLNNEVQQGDSDEVDADVAAEALNYSRASVIIQAGIAMMAQTNKYPQQELNILQNITAK